MLCLATPSVVLAMLAFAAPASALTETFNFTGAAQTWTVPNGVGEATFDVYGAQGSNAGAEEGFQAAGGGQATATIAVTPHDSIQVNVGGQGSDEAGGFNGGGAGADVLRGQGDDDTLRGGRGKDELRGAAGTNRCRGRGSDSKHHC